MNDNTKLTETYKAEVTDILEKISSGLAKSVLNEIEPKIDYIHSIVEKVRKDSIGINEKIETTIRKFGNKIDQYKKEYNTEIKHSFNEINTKITLLKNNTEDTIQTNHNILIEKVSKELLQITNLLNNQNETETIINRINDVNSNQKSLLGEITNNSDITNKELQVIKDSINRNQRTLESETVSLKHAISNNNEYLQDTNKVIEINVLKQLANISLIVDKIHSNNVLEIRLNETQTKQERTNKFIYLLIGIVMAVLITTISILFK